MKTKRIILDTNLWISFLISNNLSQIDSLIKSRTLTLIFSNESLEEFIDVIQRPKLSKYFTIIDTQQILQLFDDFGELISVKSNIEICRDAKDNFLLNLSLDGKADYLITGDKDLLVLGKIGNTEIIKFTDFTKSLE